MDIVTHNFKSKHEDLVMKQENAKVMANRVKKPLLDRDAKGLADEFYKRLQEAGLESRDVINVTTQLLGIATDAMGSKNNTMNH